MAIVLTSGKHLLLRLFISAHYFSYTVLTWVSMSLLRNIPLSCPPAKPRFSFPLSYFQLSTNYAQGAPAAQVRVRARSFAVSHSGAVEVFDSPTIYANIRSWV